MEKKKSVKNAYRIIYLLLLLALPAVLSGCMSKDEKLMRELREDGIAFMKEGDNSAAIVRFDQALSLNSGKVTEVEKDILLYRAEAEVLTGDYGAADYTYSLLLKEEPDNTAYKDLRVICMVQSGGDLNKALEMYKKADEEDPLSEGHRKALYQLGAALSASGNADHAALARELYAEAVERNGGATAELYNRMGSISFQDGDYDKALEYINAGIDLIVNDPENEEAAVLQSLEYNRIICYEYKQEYRKALKYFETYQKEYGTDDIVDHEKAFLESRVK